MLWSDVKFSIATWNGKRRMSRSATMASRFQYRYASTTVRRSPSSRGWGHNDHPSAVAGRDARPRPNRRGGFHSVAPTPTQGLYRAWSLTREDPPRGVNPQVPDPSIPGWTGTPSLPYGWRRPRLLRSTTGNDAGQPRPRLPRAALTAVSGLFPVVVVSSTTGTAPFNVRAFNATLHAVFFRLFAHDEGVDGPACVQN